jgi:hypothetical protein
MVSARIGAVLTWLYAAGFGLTAIPVSIYLVRRGTLPWFGDMFPMYGGPWSTRVSQRTFVVLLSAFCAVTLAAATAAAMVWAGSRTGAWLTLALLPVEAVFWLGFALPIPWILAVARLALLAVAWRWLR